MSMLQSSMTSLTLFQIGWIHGMSCALLENLYLTNRTDYRYYQQEIDDCGVCGVRGTHFNCMLVK